MVTGGLDEDQVGLEIPCKLTATPPQTRITAKSEPSTMKEGNRRPLTASTSALNDQKNSNRGSQGESHHHSDRDADRQTAKKRRISVRIACNSCRSNKTACDGKRPQCTRCIKKKISCEYLTANKEDTPRMALISQVDDLKQKLEEHAGLLDHLQSVSDHEALSVIRQLRTTRNVTGVLASIKSGPCTAYRPSDLQTARAILPPTRSGNEFELTILHASVYPSLAPLDFESTNANNFLRTALNRSPGSWPRFPVCGQRARKASVQSGPLPSPAYCDDRLQYLEIGYWTDVPLNDVLAASAISMYLENEHSILALFDADLVLNDLINKQLSFCSAFLVSSLLYLACNSYALVDPRATSVSLAFFAEAKRLWTAERSIDTPATLSAIMLFGCACSLDGKETLALLLFREARLKAARMDLFGVPDTRARVRRFRQMSPERIREHSHAAWGAYNWLSTHAMFLREDPIPFPPTLPIPGDVRPVETDPSVSCWPPHALPSYMGQTLTCLSKFCIIIQEILAAYFGDDVVPLVHKVSLAFAEAKYQKLLSWADTLSKEMVPGDHSPAHVFVLHGLFHGVVLEIFRPFVQQDPCSRLQTFSSLDSTPQSVYAASLNQLKRLAYVYMAQLQPECYNSVFVTALLHLNHALLYPHNELEWRFYFALSMNYYKNVCIQFIFIADVVRAQLSMAMQRGFMTSKEAYQLMEEFNQSSRRHVAIEQAMTSCIVDFDKAMTTPHEAQAHELAQRFEDLAIFNEFTKGDYENPAYKHEDNGEP